METLPREMLQEILGWADVASRVRAEQINSLWAALARESWKAVHAVRVRGRSLEVRTSDGRVTGLPLRSDAAPALAAILNRTRHTLRSIELVSVPSSILVVNSQLARHIMNEVGDSLSVLHIKDTSFQIFAGPKNDELDCFRALFSMPGISELSVVSCLQLEEPLLTPALGYTRNMRQLTKLHLVDAALSTRALIGICRGVAASLTHLCLKFDNCGYSGDSLAGALGLLVTLQHLNIGGRRLTSRPVGASLSDDDARRLLPMWVGLRSLSLRASNLSGALAAELVGVCPALQVLNFNRCPRLGAELCRARPANPALRVFAYATPAAAVPVTAGLRLITDPEEQDESEFFGEEKLASALSSDEEMESDDTQYTDSSDSEEDI